MNRKEVEDNLIFLGITGSVAYGTNIASSDVDLKGIMIAPRPYYLGNKTFEQKDSWGDEPGSIAMFDECKDKVVYELRKFMQLVIVQNPNILDLLWLDESDILVSTDLYERIRNVRHTLLSKQVFNSFTGYANAQLKRMENHRKWLLEEAQGIGVKMPEPKDYLPPDFADTQLLSVAELNAFYEFLVMLMKDRIQYFNEFEMIREGMSLVDWKGLIKQYQLPLESFPYIERTTYAAKDYLTLLHATQTYNSDLRKYHNWKSWKTNRNPARAEGERKVGYDCHIDSTEYLTLQGFKQYDQITELDSIGTYDTTTGELKFEPYLHRFSYDVEDIDIYELNTYKTSLAVTENHRLWIQPVTRKPSRNYKPVESGEWRFTTPKDLPNDFNYATRFENNNKDYDISDEKLKLIGIYVAEGCINYKISTKGVASPKSIRIEQEISGKANSLFTEEFCAFWGIKTYRYKKRNNTYEGFVYVIDNKELAKEIESLCGRYSIDKKLPDFIYLLSKRQIEILLHSMYLGDGTQLKNNAVVYYTISPLLADQVQILSTLCDKYSYVTGYSQSSGYKPCKIYHVYISNQYNKGHNHARKCQSSSVVKYSGRIHCFETSNSTLVTRLNGKIAIQGNSKNASHCIRLQRMCIEILTQGEVYVRRPDAEYLKSIRNGEVSYEAIIEESERLRNMAEDARKTSTLPERVDSNNVSDLTQSIVEEKLDLPQYVVCLFE